MKVLQKTNEIWTIELSRGENGILFRVVLNVRHNVAKMSKQAATFDKEFSGYLISNLKGLFEPFKERLPRPPRPDDASYQRILKDHKQAFQEVKVIRLTHNEIELIKASFESVFNDDKFSADSKIYIGCSIDKIKDLYNQVFSEEQST